MNKLMEVLAGMSRIPDLGKKFLLTLMIVALCAFGLFVLQPTLTTTPSVWPMTDLMPAAVAFILFVGAQRADQAHLSQENGRAACALQRPAKLNLDNVCVERSRRFFRKHAAAMRPLSLECNQVHRPGLQSHDHRKRQDPIGRLPGAPICRIRTDRKGLYRRWLCSPEYD